MVLIFERKGGEREVQEGGGREAKERSQEQREIERIRGQETEGSIDNHSKIERKGKGTIEVEAKVVFEHCA